MQFSESHDWHSCVDPSCKFIVHGQHWHDANPNAIVQVKIDMSKIDMNEVRAATEAHQNHMLVKMKSFSKQPSMKWRREDKDGGVTYVKQVYHK